QAALATGRARFFRGKPVRRPLAVRHLAAFAAGDPGFFGRKLMRGPFLVSRFPTLARNRPLFGFVHAGKAPTLLLSHALVPFCIERCKSRKSNTVPMRQPVRTDRPRTPAAAARARPPDAPAPTVLAAPREYNEQPGNPALGS